MKVTDTENLKGTERAVDGIGFRSIRPVLASDGMGFSIHKTEIFKGGPYHWHYKNHLESCYCVKGRGILKNLETGEEFLIKPNVVYSLDNHDDHTFTAMTDVVLISVFNPPITGSEIHDEQGNYELREVAICQ